MTNKKRWSDLTDRQRTIIAVAAAVEFVVTTVALVDLTRRSRAQVRGPKPLWVASFAVQPAGPLAYFALGRRGAPS